MNKKDFLKLIKDKRAEKKEEKFEGTLIDYVELVQQNPNIAKLAHKRLYDAIVDQGVEEMSSDDPRKRKIFNGDSVKVKLINIDELNRLKFSIKALEKKPDNYNDFDKKHYKDKKNTKFKKYSKK